MAAPLPGLVMAGKENPMINTGHRGRAERRK